MKPRRKHLHTERTRHGQTIYYFRKGNGPRIRLPDNYGEASFWEAYRLAFDHGISVPRAKPTRSTFEQNQRKNVGLALQRAIGSAKARAAERGVQFDLTYEWAIETVERQKMKCALTGIPFFMATSARSRVNPYLPSIDRIDAGGDYTRDNVRLVIWAVNVMLMDWGIEVFERVANGYRWAKGTKTKLLFPHPSTHGPHLFKSEARTDA